MFEPFIYFDSVLVCGKDLISSRVFGGCQGSAGYSQDERGGHGKRTE